MSAYLWLSFICHCLIVVICMGRLSHDVYPRIEEKTRGNDIIGLYLQTVLSIWVGFLLFA